LAQTASADLLQASADDQARYAEQATMINRNSLLRALRAFNDAVNNYTGGWQPQLSLELAFIESLQEPEPVQMVAQASFASPTPAPQKKESVENFERAKPSPKGAPPAIAASVVQAKWGDAQRLIFQNSHNASEVIVNLPNLMEYTKVVAVEGNTVIVGVQTQIYLDKLSDDTRVKWVERAISNVTNTKNLRIRYILMSEAENFSSGENTLSDDPLIQEGLGLGGQIREED
jgi:DNA polymerase III gamma/tau subunit